MSRFLIAFSLVAVLSSTSMARAVSAPRFAQPPVDSSEEYMPDRLIAPTRVLDRATVRAKLVANRAANLARFRAYQTTGTFPSNTYGKRKLNVWRDEAGNLCAAATIISASGMSDLVIRVAEQNNFIRLGDVQQGPLMDWILTSGLTQAEIAAIQEPFMDVEQQRRMAGLAPMPVPDINPRLRTAEDLRLIKKYQQVTAMLVKNQKRSIELAVDRLMKHPALAWQLIDR
jgi:hypothetical protein